MAEPKLLDRPTDGECKCGRPASKVHCPICGRMDIYCRSQEQNIVTNQDGSQTLLRVYRCKTCGIVFNDQDWMLRCMAPFKKKSRREMVDVMLLRSQQQATDTAKIIQEKFGGDTHAYARSLAEQVQQQMGVKTKRQRETNEERMERIERESLLSKKSMDIMKPPTTSDASQQQSDSTTDESKPLSEAEVLEKFRKLGIKI